MRLVFMGTPDFAVPSLKRIYDDGHDVAAVLTQPDKPSRRGMKMSFSPVKELALERGTPVYQPASLKDGDITAVLHELKCQLIAVVAYGKLLTREMLELPPLGCINIHGSLLPKYRGAAPIQWAIINGERETGVTSMYMAEKLDAGDVLLTKKTPIGGDETAGDLFERLGEMGAGLLSETIDAIICGNAAPKPQDDNSATFAPPLVREMSPIDWNNTAFNIKCKVRGLNPWPVASAEWGGTVYKIFSVDIGDTALSSQKKPGEILSAGSGGLEVACSDGTVKIRELQAPGGRRMPAADYLRGHSIPSAPKNIQ